MYRNIMVGLNCVAYIIVVLQLAKRQTKLNEGLQTGKMGRQDVV